MSDLRFRYDYNHRFNDGENGSVITYVIARYSTYQKCWFHCTEYTEIEDAKEAMKELRKYSPYMKITLFEVIESYCINQLVEKYLQEN